MAGVQGLMRVGKKALHFALLVFTAFWLVATSAPRKAARDCFVPLKRHELLVTLGARQPAETGARGRLPVPSCETLDGLKPDAVLSMKLTRSAKPPDVHSAGLVCWGYDVAELRGANDVRGFKSDDPQAYFALIETRGQFEHHSGQCSGSYSLVLKRASAIPEGKLVDPVAPAPPNTWRLQRSIRVGANQACPALPTMPEGYCADDFEVRSVTYAP